MSRRTLVTALLRGLLLGSLFQAVVGTVGCDQAGPPLPLSEARLQPDEASLYLFRLARLADPPPEELEVLFGQETDLRKQAALYDALHTVGALLGDEPPRVVEEVAMDGIDPVAIDLEATAPGGGITLFSVQLEATDDGGWKVRWFQGPGVGWPAFRGKRPGLTSGPEVDPS